MTCAKASTLLAEELLVPLDADTAVELNAHLSSCETCRSEASVIRNTWAQLAALPEPEPSPRVATRFYAALDAYEGALREKKSRGFWSWWPAAPVWQFAIALGCLLVGFFAGAAVLGERSASGELAELRKEMSGMRQLVTLSLLQQQSANERLRGVTYSYRAEPDDVEILSALLDTANQDPSVDVRLAAIDALRNLSANRVARRGLVQSLAKQDSPLTQIAIIDALTEMREPSATPAMQALLAEPALDTNVRKRLEGALQKFQ
jgi:hypothetical protein